MPARWVFMPLWRFTDPIFINYVVLFIIIVLWSDKCISLHLTMYYMVQYSTRVIIHNLGDSFMIVQWGFWVASILNMGLKGTWWNLYTNKLYKELLDYIEIQHRAIYIYIIYIVWPLYYKDVLHNPKQQFIEILHDAGT